MKKTVSLIIAFLIVCAFTAGCAYGVGKLFDQPYLYENGQALVLGLCGGTGGVLAPILIAAISKRLSIRKR